MTPEEFDSLAIFVAVVEELKQEPFFSDDNHDMMQGHTGIFCHPMFLKSAVLPFRKIWMPSERCAFRGLKGKGGIRDLVFREYKKNEFTEGYRSWFYDTFDIQLSTPVGPNWSNESKQEIINLWLNTQLAHTGPKNPAKKKPYEVELVDFNKCDAKIGREKFEFLFRSSVGTIGHSYISFEQLLAFPLFQSCLDKGMKPSFEAEVALKYSPYSNPKYKIIYDDFFWHLKRETPQETFERLLARQLFGSLSDFLRSIFSEPQQVVESVAKLENLEELLKDSGTEILNKNSKPEGRLLRRSVKNTDLALGARGQVAFDAYEGRKVLFQNNSESTLAALYKRFRQIFLEERSQQRKPIKGHEWR